MNYLGTLAPAVFYVSGRIQGCGNFYAAIFADEIVLLSLSLCSAFRASGGCGVGAYLLQFDAI